jgi:hypothetical protein
MAEWRYSSTNLDLSTAEEKHVFKKICSMLILFPTVYRKKNIISF